MVAGEKRVPQSREEGGRAISRGQWWAGAVVSQTWELGMLYVVCVYCFFTFLALAFDDKQVQDLLDEGTRHVVSDVFLWIDLIFMIGFSCEIGLKIYATGRSYVRDALNVIDIIIVGVSLILTTMAIAASLVSRGTPVLNSAQRVVKVLRLLRVVLSITRLQRSRERFKRLKMAGLSAPVDKVFDIILDLRKKVTQPDDDKALQWTMDLIAKEELYKVNLDSRSNQGGMGHLTSEMTDWLRTNLQVHVKPKPESGSTNGAIAKERGSAARRGSKQLEKAQAPAWVLRSIAETSVARLLDAADTWDFDVFAFAEATCMHPLVVGGLHLFQRMGLLDRVGVPRDRLANYLLAVERGYIGTNPFHNQLHAADVMFTTYYQLQAPLMREITAPLDIFATLLSATVHDFAHPGLSNMYLMNTRSPEAILYNDQSVLEMFHISGAFRVMHSTPGCDFTEFMSRDQYRQFRETMISTVLSTDLKMHFEHLGRMKTRLATDAYASVERKDVLLLLGQCVHSSDISNPTKSPELMMRWTERVMIEFWLQGDQERTLGMPISAFMDRTHPTVAQCQIGFINVLVKPLFIEMHKLLGELIQPAIDCIDANLAMWEAEGNVPAAGWESRHSAELAAAPAAGS